MKILYAIQGTGNGHISRARDIIPVLGKMGDLDILISGIQADVDLPYPVRFRLRGLSFIFGKKGGVDIVKTLQAVRPIQVIREILSIPVEDYHLILNDFEPITAWACRLRKKHCIALSHQSALRSPFSPKPPRFDLIGKIILRYYAPANSHYGFHFKSYSENIFTPVIRSEIRSLEPSHKGHYTVYLPAYDDRRIFEFLENFPEVHWEVFSKHNKEFFQKKNIKIQPIENEKFIESLQSCTGVLCGAGFETPAETIYLGKKLLVIPMQTQYEQHCNAAALSDLGIPVVHSLNNTSIPIVKNWILNGKSLQISFPNETQKILEFVISRESSKR